MRRKLFTIKFWFVLVGIMCWKSIFALEVVNHPALIPMPQQISWNNELFTLDEPVQMILPEGLNAAISDKFCSFFPRITKGKSKQIAEIRISKNILHGQNTPEAYQLRISNDSLLLIASSDTAVFRAMQTIRQLQTENAIAGCLISDWPAFSMRGFMQDTGRNFMSPGLLKEQIDVMSAYKFNYFHWHLTDNPAWRLESKKYPELKEASSMSRWPGKYYTQEDFLTILNYCTERFITIIPELDVPGHCEAFRKAFAIDSMSDARVKPILLDLIDELCALAPKETMPFIHLGTDEVWHRHERPEANLLSALMERVHYHGREAIVWRPGQQIDGDNSSITQLWSSAGQPKDGHRYLDSRLNYLNHLDPLQGIAQLYFDRISGASHGNSLCLGGVLCCWNDNNLSHERDVLRQNPVYPGMLVYSESAWKGNDLDTGTDYLATLPQQGTEAINRFQNFEKRLCEHRDRYFQDKPFPYVANTHIPWKWIGPFDHQGNTNMQFQVEESIHPSYEINGKEYRWNENLLYGGTIHVNHFFGYPSPINEKSGTVYATTMVFSPKEQTVGCWIGFHDWSRSGGRRGGPSPEQRQWHTTNPKIWINDTEIAPPKWMNPALPAQSEEIPFVDENYFHRPATTISLKKGWNRILLKVPQGGTSWKWMFTFVPVHEENGGVKEVEGLIFSAE